MEEKTMVSPEKYEVSDRIALHYQNLFFVFREELERGILDKDTLLILLASFNQKLRSDFLEEEKEHARNS